MSSFFSFVVVFSAPLSLFPAHLHQRKGDLHLMRSFFFCVCVYVCVRAKKAPTNKKSEFLTFFILCLKNSNMSDSFFFFLNSFLSSRFTKYVRKLTLTRRSPFFPEEAR